MGENHESAYRTVFGTAISIRSFQSQVQKMSREQAQEFLVKLYGQMIVRENMYKQFLKYEWGLEPPAPR